MRYLTLEEVTEAHKRVIAESGGSSGVQELYPSLEEKAAALGFSLINNHPFVDGNKRIGHAAMATFVRLNGFRISAPVDEQETFVLRLAAGEGSREELVEWLRGHLVPLNP
jgi:death-on-curing protein